MRSIEQYWLPPSSVLNEAGQGNKKKGRFHTSPKGEKVTRKTLYFNSLKHSALSTMVKRPNS